MDEAEFRYKDNTVHPRQAEILRNNYNLFIDRASRAWQHADTQYYSSCVNQAAEAAEQYQKITGKDLRNG